jgi:hypothetical protein
MNSPNTQTFPDRHLPPVWFLLLALAGVIEVVAPLVSQWM